MTHKTYFYLLIILFTIFACTKAKEEKDDKKDISLSRPKCPSEISFNKVRINQIKIKWKDNSSSEDGFKIDKKVDNGKWKNEYGGTKADAKWWIDQAANVNQTLQYRVYAYKQDLNSEYLKTAKIKNYIPAPKNLKCKKISSEKIELSWSYISIGENGFYIDKKVGNSKWEIKYRKVNANVTKLIDKISGVRSDIRYRICAFYKDELSANSQIDMINNVPPTPQNLSYKLEGDRINLSWKFSGTDVDEFVIARKIGKGNWNNSWMTVTSDTYSWVGTLPDPNKYCYKIRAKYRNNFSDFSKQIFCEFTFIWVNISSGNSYYFGDPPQKKIMNHPYKIMKYEISNKQYVLYLTKALKNNKITADSLFVKGYFPGNNFLDSGNYNLIDIDDEDCRIYWNGNTFKIVSGYENHPVVEVTWFGACAFAQHYGFRLPTESEWKCAASGNSQYNYPWGDDISGQRANFWSSDDPFEKGNWEKLPQSTPVGFYDGDVHNGFQTLDNSSQFGLYDMAGNVWEWTSSNHNSSGLIEYIIKGGSFGDSPQALKSSSIKLKRPYTSHYSIGFRCVLD